LAGIGAAPQTLRGQVEESGAATLLLPFSARAVGVGNAHVADGVGTDAVVSNPSALAWLTRREAGLYYGQEFATNRILAGVAWPRGAAGTFAVSAALLDLGEQAATNGQGVQTGTLANRDVILAGSYGSALGSHFALGVTYRFFQRRFDCTGDCNPEGDPATEPQPSASTSAMDFGVQYDAGPRIPLVLGAAVRHLGLRLQVQDEAQADRLPTQLSVGARYEVPNLARRVPGAELKLLGEFVTGVQSASTRELRFGAEGVYRKSFLIRAGYIFGGENNESDGPAIGFGYAGRRVAFDMARQLTGFSADAGEPPTYFALRYWF
jgi:hypothetical protein